MTKEQIDLLTHRFIFEPQKYKWQEPDLIKQQKDLEFCKKFFNHPHIDIDVVRLILTNSINRKNEFELDLVLMLINHFDISENFDMILAPLLVQPWHHLHDRIATILEFDENEATIEYLFLGSLYRCDNLDYESDYCGFNKKCLYALAKIGTKRSIDYIKKVSSSNNPIISNHAKNLLSKL